MVSAPVEGAPPAPPIGGFPTPWRRGPSGACQCPRLGFGGPLRNRRDTPDEHRRRDARARLPRPLAAGRRGGGEPCADRGDRCRGVRRVAGIRARRPARRLAHDRPGPRRVGRDQAGRRVGRRRLRSAPPPRPHRRRGLRPHRPDRTPDQHPLGSPRRGADAGARAAGAAGDAGRGPQLDQRAQRRCPWVAGAGGVRSRPLLLPDGV